MKKPISFICFAVLLFLASCNPSPDGPKISGIKGNQVITVGGKTLTIPGLGESETTTFILVRHAEKQSSDDPGLNIQGADRANHLAEILKDFPLQGIYATNTKRTRATAAPCAKMNDLPVINYTSENQNNLFEGMLSRGKGGSYLIVGHSNTIPPLLNLFKGKQVYENIDENVYDDLFIAIVKTSGDAEIIELKY